MTWALLKLAVSHYSSPKVKSQSWEKWESGAHFTKLTIYKLWFATWDHFLIVHVDSFDSSEQTSLLHECACSARKSLFPLSLTCQQTFGRRDGTDIETSANVVYKWNLDGYLLHRSTQSFLILSTDHSLILTPCENLVITCTNVELGLLL